MTLTEKLKSIRVLFRAPDTLGLYGIPYDMRPGQQPGDLWRSTSIGDAAAAVRGVYGRRIPTPGPRSDWIYLGHPGWWASMPTEDQDAVKAFLAPLEAAGLVPGGPYEWTEITEEK